MIDLRDKMKKVFRITNNANSKTLFNFALALLLGGFIASCSNDDIVSDENLTTNGEQLPPITLNIDTLKANGANIQTSTRAIDIAEFSVENTASSNPQLVVPATGKFTSHMMIYNKTKNLKAYGELTWKVNATGSDIYLINKDAQVSVTHYQTGFSLSAGDEVYMNVLLGGGVFDATTFTSSGRSTFDIVFNPSQTSSLTGTKVNAVYYTGWQKVTVDATNSLNGSLKFAPQGNLIKARVLRDKSISENYEYRLISNRFSGIQTFKMANISTLNDAGTTSAPVYTSATNGTQYNATRGVGYYVEDARNITQVATSTGEIYDIMVFWGMPIAATTNTPTAETKLVPKYSGYFLVDEANTATQAQKVSNSELNGNARVYRFTLKPQAPADPNGTYSILNPLENLAEYNMNRTGGFKTTAYTGTNTDRDQAYFRNSEIGNYSVPTGYSIPSRSQAAVAWPNELSTRYWTTTDASNTGTITPNATATSFNELMTIKGAPRVKTGTTNNTALYKGSTNTDETTQTYSATYINPAASTTGTWYALRFENGSVTQNDLKCAYKYEFVKNGTATSAVTITSRYVGDRWDLSFSDLQATYWNSKNIKVNVVRTIPIVGFFRPVLTGVQELGKNAYYWTCEQNGSYGASSNFIEYSNLTQAEIGSDGATYYYPIRPVNKRNIYLK